MVREGGVVYVEARVGVFTAVVMSPLNLSNIDATAVFGDQLGGVGARGLIKSEHDPSSITKLSVRIFYLIISSFIEAQQSVQSVTMSSGLAKSEQ